MTLYKIWTKKFYNGVRTFPDNSEFLGTFLVKNIAELKAKIEAKKLNPADYIWERQRRMPQKLKNFTCIRNFAMDLVNAQ